MAVVVVSILMSSAASCSVKRAVWRSRGERQRVNAVGVTSIVDREQFF